MVESDSVRNWVAISSAMIGVTLTILILIITLLGGEGTTFDTLGNRIIIYLLLVAFVLFVNAVTTNARVLYEMARASEESFVNKWIKFAEFSFGLGFTLVIVTFALTTYIYVDILASTILMVVAWIIMFIYTFLNDPADKSVFANGMAANNGRIGTDGSAFPNERFFIKCFSPLRIFASRIEDVGKNHRRAAEDVIFKLDTFIDRNIILNLDMIADSDVVPHIHILPK